MKLPELEVKVLHYWTLLIYDELRPKGEECHQRFDTLEEAEAALQKFVDKRLATRRKR